MSGNRSVCRNCGESIRWINYSFCPRWMHQHPGASFNDGVYEYCKQAVATPSAPSIPVSSTPGVEAAHPRNNNGLAT